MTALYARELAGQTSQLSELSSINVCAERVFYSRFTFIPRSTFHQNVVSMNACFHNFSLLMHFIINICRFQFIAYHIDFRI